MQYSNLNHILDADEIEAPQRPSLQTLRQPVFPHIVKLAMEISACSDNAYGDKGVVLEHDEMHTWITSANCRSGRHDERKQLPLQRETLPLHKPGTCYEAAPIHTRPILEHMVQHHCRSTTPTTRPSTSTQATTRARSTSRYTIHAAYSARTQLVRRKLKAAYHHGSRLLAHPASNLQPCQAAGTR